MGWRGIERMLLPVLLGCSQPSLLLLLEVLVVARGRVQKRQAADGKVLIRAVHCLLCGPEA